MRLWIWALIAAVVITGIIVITLWQTGHLTSGGPSSEVDPTGTIPATNEGSFKYNFKRFDDFYTVTMNFQMIDISLSDRGYAKAANFSAVGKYYVGYHLRFSNLDFGSGVILASPVATKFTTMATALIADGSHVAILGQTLDNKYQLKFVEGEEDRVVSTITLFTGRRQAAIDPALFFYDNTCYVGYFNTQSNDFRVDSLKLTDGVWIQSSELTSNHTRLIGVSKYTMLVTASSGGQSVIVPYYRASAKDKWTTPATITAHEPFTPRYKEGNCVLLHEGRTILLLRNYDGGIFKAEAFRWNGTDYVSLGVSQTWSVTNPNPNGLILSGCARTSLFLVTSLGSGGDPGWFELFEAPTTKARILSSTVTTTDQLFSSSLKKWPFLTSYNGGALQMSWNSSTGIDIAAGFINSDNKTEQANLSIR